MIDLHSHILPGIDDGAGTLVESIEMAQLAVKDGIRLLAATPHHMNGRYNNESRVVKQAVDSLNQELDRQHIPLKVLHGQEVRINEQFWGEWEAGNLLTLNDSRYMLIELPNQHVPREVWEIIHELRIKGIVPIIAHPERNIELASNMETLVELVEAGALAQITSHSLNGLFGSRIRQVAIRMCGRNLIHIIASDAHNADRRNFGMADAYQYIHRRLGQVYTQYYKDNAQAIYDNQPIPMWEPRAAKRWYQRW